jgi:signal transduction histidine kinase
MALRRNQDAGCHLGVVVADSGLLAQFEQWVVDAEEAVSRVEFVATTQPEGFDAYALLVAPGAGMAEKLHQWIAAANAVPCLVIAPHDDPDLMQVALDVGAFDFLPASETSAQDFTRALRFACRHSIRYAQALESEKLLFVQRENDRYHLATVLHDGPLQDLIGARFLLSVPTAGEKNQTLVEVQQSLQAVTRVVRELCSDLKPPALEPFGFEKALRALAQEVGRRHESLTIQLDVDEDRQSIPHWVRLSLYRILQKALRNVTQHAAATQTWIQFRLGEERIRLTVADDGRGFPVEGNLAEDWLAFGRRGQYGLLGMYARAQTMRGRFVVQSTVGNGTRIVVDIPRIQPAGLTAQSTDSASPDLNRDVQDGS